MIVAGLSLRLAAVLQAARPSLFRRFSLLRALDHGRRESRSPRPPPCWIWTLNLTTARRAQARRSCLHESRSASIISVPGAAGGRVMRSCSLGGLPAGEQHHDSTAGFYQDQRCSSAKEMCCADRPARLTKAQPDWALTSNFCSEIFPWVSVSDMMISCSWSDRFFSDAAFFSDPA